MATHRIYCGTTLVGVCTTQNGDHVMNIAQGLKDEHPQESYSVKAGKKHISISTTILRKPHQ